MASALAALMSAPRVPLASAATPLDEMTRLRAALGPAAPRLFVKRDDLLSFAVGGNKVRKMQMVAAEALAAGADTLITCGGVQSNHARVTAAAGAALGLDVVLILNRAASSLPDDLDRGNARLDRLFGAEIRYVSTRDERAPAMAVAAAERRAASRRPYVVPLGASTPTGALGIALAIQEIAASGVKPDVIVHATSSGGTQAGLIAGCALFGVRARIIGISADDPPATLVPAIRQILDGVADRLGAKAATIGADLEIDVRDRWVGDGYGIPTAASAEATELTARREGIVLDPVYTAKAMAGLIGLIREAALRRDQTVVFWHTGGIPGYFA